MTAKSQVQVSAEDCPVIRWLMTEGRHIADAKSFLESFAACLRVAGVELRNAGVTDYVVLPVPFSDGTNKALSLATTRVDGFSDDEIALFAAMMPAVAVNLEIQALRRMARRSSTPTSVANPAAAFSPAKSAAAWGRPSTP